MKISVPAYYHQFRCIASACPDSCCPEWDVDVDDASAAYYRSLPGDLGDRLRQVLVDTEDGTVMAIENGRCPMWRADGLCRIQAELGHDALCAVCQRFPRLTHDYGSHLDRDLELSCPEAARLIFSCDDRLTTGDAPGGEEADDPATLDILLRSREAVLEFLSDTRRSLPRALTALLLYGHHLQEELDGGDTATLDPDADLPCSGGDMDAIFAFFQSLEILTPRWQSRLEAGPRPGSWDLLLYAFARYMVRRYWLQAVSDYDILCRVKFIVVSCLLLKALGGDTVETAQLFSKEIENDPDNVEAILDGAYRSPALTDTNLLALLTEV